MLLHMLRVLIMMPKNPVSLQSGCVLMMMMSPGVFFFWKWGPHYLTRFFPLGPITRESKTRAFQLCVDDDVMETDSPGLCYFEALLGILFFTICICGATASEDKEATFPPVCRVR